MQADMRGEIWKPFLTTARASNQLRTAAPSHHARDAGRNSRRYRFERSEIHCAGFSAAQSSPPRDASVKRETLHKSPRRAQPKAPSLLTNSRCAATSPLHSGAPKDLKSSRLRAKN